MSSRFRKILYILGAATLVCYTPKSFAASDVVTMKDIERTVHGIITLGKRIDKQRDIALQGKLVEKREVLARYLHTILLTLETKIHKKPTLDISSDYDFALQKYKLSCEIAALRMILNVITKGAYTEEQIFTGLPIYAAPLSWNGIWGDPDKEFVGYYTGSQRVTTGFGVYEKPLQRFLKYEKIESQVANIHDGRDISPRERIREVLTTIQDGGQVLLWGDWCTKPENDDGVVENVDTYLVSRLPIAAKNICTRTIEERKLRWTTPAGKVIDAISGEHAFILLGYIGPLEKPSHIIVFDTDTGRHIYPYSEWMRKWALMEYRSLLIPKKL